MSTLTSAALVTEWHHRDATVFDGEASELLRLSGIAIPDGVMRRHRSHSSEVQMTIGRISYGCDASIDLPKGTLRIGRAIHNGNASALEGRHALVLGVSLLGTVNLSKIRDGEGQSFVEEAFPLDETVVQPHGAAFAIELDGGRSLSCSTESRVIRDDGFSTASKPELGLLVHRTRDVLYVGAAVLGEGNGLVLPPMNELQISSVVTLG